MRGLARLFFLLSAISLLPFGCNGEDTGTTGTGANNGQPCERESDCEDDNPCTFDFCVSNRCANNDATNGPQVGAEQTDGDCMVVACQDGVSAVINDDNDPPEDPVGGDCVEPACMMGASMTVNRPANSGCDANGSQGACDGMGTCSCAVATADPNAVAWVDPVDGNDVPGQGARPGGCAFKTITFALSQFPGQIRLVGGATYDSTTETFPLVFGGTQYLRCSDNNGNDTSTLVGNGSYAGGTSTVVFTGTENGMRDCTIQAGGASDAILLESNAGGGLHELRNNDVSGATNAVTVATAGDRWDVFNNSFHDNSGIAFNVLGGDKIGQLDDNDFATNGGGDVLCASGSPQFQGGNNVGIVSCNGCDNCPF